VLKRSIPGISLGSRRADVAASRGRPQQIEARDPAGAKREDDDS
jgi:hypothetical protein